jgi:hypothetical protein
MDPKKMISCANASLLRPIASVNKTNTRLPPKIHQFGRVFSAGSNSRRLEQGVPNPVLVDAFSA